MLKLEVGVNVIVSIVQHTLLYRQMLNKNKRTISSAQRTFVIPTSFTAIHQWHSHMRHLISRHHHNHMGPPINPQCPNHLVPLQAQEVGIKNGLGLGRAWLYGVCVDDLKCTNGMLLRNILHCLKVHSSN